MQPIFSIYWWLILGLFFCNPCAGQSTYLYQPSSGDFVNPERGMYRYFETRTADGYTPLNVVDLQQLRSQEQQSLIYRIFYLDGFYADTLSTSVLTSITQDFTTLRSAGVKAIVRFAYTDAIRYDSITEQYIQPFNDTPAPALVFEHINQLGPILAANSDVILTVHNGFYGTWGENYYSDYFGSPAFPPITPIQQQRRDAVTDSLLQYLPADRSISVRYPGLKAHYLGLSVPGDSLTAATAYQGTPISRIGFHNDCFLADFNDWTFVDTLTEKPYWAAESQYVIMGGESCRDIAQYTNCANALAELQRFHWTYMNDYYHPDVLQRWQNEGCYTDIRKKLGYRILLHEAQFPNEATYHTPFTVQFDLENTGWAAPVMERPVELVLRSVSDQTEFVLPVSQLDLRTLKSGHRKLFAPQVTIDGQIPAGAYALFLFFPDDRSSLRADPAFAMRLANEGIWDATTGMHELGHTLLVQEAACPIDTTLQDGPLGNGQYRARDGLTVQTDVSAGATVFFRAGQSIRFLPGFSISQGSEMEACIETCVSASAPSPMAGVVPQSNEKPQLGIQYWPNPVSDQLTVLVSPDISSAEAESLLIVLMDARGRRMISLTCQPGDQRSVDVSFLPQGTYFLAWNSSQGRQSVMVVKQ